MWSILYTIFKNNINSVIIGGISLLLLFGGNWYYTGELNKRDTTIAKLELDILLLKNTLDTQNDAIDKLRITEEDLSKIKNLTKELDKSTRSTIHSIERQLEINSTDSNKLIIIDNLLKEFSNE